MQASKHFLPGVPPHSHPATGYLPPNHGSNSDGWGITYFDAQRRARLHKSPKALDAQDDDFSALMSRRSSSIMGHIRAGTGAPVAAVNCHPFVFGGLSLCHNGGLANFDGLLEYRVPRVAGSRFAGSTLHRQKVTVRQQMYDRMSKGVQDRIQGQTDSEHLGQSCAAWTTRVSAITKA